MSVAEIFSAFFAPLTDAVADVKAMEDLLSDLGVEVRLQESHKAVLDQLLPIQQTLEQIEDVASGGQQLDLEDLADLATTVFDTVVALSTAPANLRNALPGELIQAATWAAVAEELPGHLVLTWLEDFQPVFAALLELGGAIDLVQRGQGKPPRRVLNWQSVADLITNPPAQIAATWRFGGSDFDADGFLKAFALLVYAIGPLPRLKGKGAQLAAALGNRDAPAATRVLEVAALSGQIEALQATARLDLVGASEAGGQSGPAGLALVPTIEGSLEEDFTLSDDITFTVSTSGSASGGAGLVITPSGLDRLGTLSGTASVSIGLSGHKQPAPGDAVGGWFLVGDKDSSHLRIERFAVSAGASVNPDDVSITVDLTDAIALYVTGGEDGLLATILGDTNVEVLGGLSAEWSMSGGWQFTGGVGLEVQIPIGRQIGPFEVDSLTLLGSAATTGLSAGAAVTGSMALGPLHMSFDEIGVVIDLEPLPDGQTGSFGPFEIAPRFKPPTGYGAGIDFTPITGGGYIEKSEAEYRGALALQFEKFGLSAFAILNTELPGGQPGFSFAASVFATFNMPLTAGFFLTGLGGVLGINRTVDTDEMREVLFDGRLDDLLFPSDPIAMAPRILEDMATILPAQAGQHFMGPVARISWGQPTLIHITLGVIIEVGEEIRLVILGGVKMALPTEDAALVIFNLQFMGEIDFTEGRIDFDATLEGSRVLIFTITGDAAIRTGWGPGITQIASLGGLHPNYPRPSNLPDLRRLSAGFGNPGDKISLSIAGYFAQTLTSVQFGARATLRAEGPKFPIIGKVSAEGTIGFDALIYFNPFSFTVGVDGGISLMVNGKVKAALYFAIDMSGPNPFRISGEVWVKVCKVKVRFAVTRTFGSRQSAPTVTASATDVLRAAIEAVSALEAAGNNANGVVTFRSGEDTEGLIDPLGRLRLTQSAVPLDLRIEKLGEADVRGTNKVDLAVFQPDGSAATGDQVTSEFVRGHFFPLNRSERLRAPAMETHKSGLEFSATGFDSAGEVISDDYSYEVIEIGLAEDEAPERPLIGIAEDQIGPMTTQYASGRFESLREVGANLVIDDSVRAMTPAYVLESDALFARDTAGGQPVVVESSLQIQALSATDLTQLDAQPSLNAQVADYLSAA